MSPRGWPKGKPRGSARSAAQLAIDKKFKAAGTRARALKRTRAAEIASGRSFGGGLNEDYRPQRAHINVTPAAWLPVDRYIGDFEYGSDGLDDILLRALRERVVYAQSVSCHHEPPFQDVTITTIAAAARYARKFKVTGPDPRKRGVPLPTKSHITKLPLSERQLQIIGLIANGLSETQIARTLGIQVRTVKMHCDVLRAKFEIGTRREIPSAYRSRTGKDPFLLIPTPKRTPYREGSSLTAVVAEMFESEVRAGRSLVEVVSEMFDPERST